MKMLIPERLASRGLMMLLLLMVLVHLAILFRFIPYAMVWGGRLTDATQMRRLEIISILVLLLMLAAVAVKAGLLPLRVPPVLINVLLWLMTVFFLLNTIGNLASLHAFERFVFAPLTFLLFLFALRLAVYRRAPRTS